MHRLITAIAALLFLALSGCATMSKSECESADWQAVGYQDGSRGIHYSRIAKHRESCGKYQIVPDDNAYMLGWDEGIRRYCTADTGYRLGAAGKAYPNICPADVEAGFADGWQQGIHSFCTPDNALRLGLSGHSYNGACPPDVAGMFQDYYRLGRDVRQARVTHERAEQQLERLGPSLAAEQDPNRRRALLHDLERLRHEEDRADAQLIALEACMSDDWYDAGYRDGEDGNPQRLPEIAHLCRSYGIAADRPGYRDGWWQGNSHYCSYESGLYIGQGNQEYRGVCSGYGHREFWRGYERGRDLFRAEKYEAHPRPVYQRPVRAAPAVQPRVQPQREIEHRPQPMPQREVTPRPQPQRQIEHRPTAPQMEQRQPQRQVEQRQPPRATPAQPAQPAPRVAPQPQRATPAVPAQPATRQPATAAQPSPKAAPQAADKAAEHGEKMQQEMEQKRQMDHEERDQPARVTPAARP